MAELPETSAEVDTSVKVFVGQLPFTFTAEEVKELFDNYGKVDDVYIIVDKVTNKSKGCAFVRFHDKDMADKAIADYHGKKTLSSVGVLYFNSFSTFPKSVHAKASRAMQVSYAEGEESKLENKLFVGQIPPQAGEEEIREVFTPFGDIVDLFLMKRPDGKHKGSAFLKFDTRKACEDAIRELNEKYTMSGAHTTLRVHYAESGNKKRKRDDNNTTPSIGMYSQMPGILQHGVSRTMPVYNAYSRMTGQMTALSRGVNGLGGGGGVLGTPDPYAAQNVGLAASTTEFKLFIGGLPLECSEYDLHQVFGWYGTIVGLYIMRDRKDGSSKGSAFVSYGTRYEADAAIAGANGMMMVNSSRPLVVRYAENNKPVGQAIMGTNMAMGATGTPAKLFVGAIPPYATEAEVSQIFGMFGRLVDVYVMRNSDGGSKGSAFVTFHNRLEAEAAIRQTNGIMMMPGGVRPLSVSFAEQGNSTSVLPTQPQQYNYMAATPAPAYSSGADVSSGTRLFVGGVPLVSMGTDVHSLFAHYGTVLEVYIMRKPNGESKGSAFVTMASREHAEAAIEGINQKVTLPGSSRPLLVSVAAPKGGTGTPNNAIVDEQAHPCNAGGKRQRTD